MLVMVVVAVWWMWSCSVVVIISKKTCVGNLSKGFFVGLVELDDVANGVGLTLLRP